MLREEKYRHLFAFECSVYSRCHLDLEIRGNSLQEDKYMQETVIWNINWQKDILLPMGLRCHGNTCSSSYAKLSIFWGIFKRNIVWNKICYIFPTICSVRISLVQPLLVSVTMCDSPVMLPNNHKRSDILTEHIVRKL